jgi:hypothetical protein
MHNLQLEDNMKNIIKWALIIFGVIIFIGIISPKKEKIISPVVEEQITTVIIPTLIPTIKLIPTNTIQPIQNNIIKKSNSGICHTPNTTYYERTINFTSFDSMEDCINSGGRLPKN